MAEMSGFNCSFSRVLPILGCVFAILLGSEPLRAEDRFVSVIADLPLMPALAETPGSAVIFAKPDGRIVEVSASGKVAKDAVLAYYGRALPQLGWRSVSGESWEREGERLQIGFDSGAGGLTVQFSLAPR